MKHCIACQFSERKATPVGRNPDGTTAYQMVMLCMHSDCSDPVEAAPLPCAFARQQQHICGWQGNHFHKKEELPKPESKLIALDR